MTEQSPEQTLHEAEILIQTGNPDKIAYAEELLRQIQQQYLGTAYATQASLLLAESDHSPNSPPVRENIKVAEALSDRWAGVGSVEHPQLSAFLTALFDLDLQAGARISGLRQQVINTLYDWLLEIDDETWLHALIEPIKQHPHFEHDLDETLATWQLAKFTHQYEVIATQVEAALKNWLVQEARQLMATLSNPSLPVTLQNQVTQLQQTIGYVEDDIHRLTILLNDCSDKPVTDWAELQRRTEQTQALQPFKPKSNYGVPGDWQDKIEKKLPTLSSHMKQFLANQAQACFDLAAVRIFYVEYNRLSFKDTDLEISWFEPFQNAYQQHNNHELKQAASLTEIAEIQQLMLADTVSLPAMLVAWLQNRVEAVSALIIQWQKMITGTEFISEVKSSVAVPDAFQRKRPQYQAIWQQLDDIAQQTDPNNVPTEPDFQLATAQLEQLLANYPKHQFAQQLLVKVKTTRQRYRFDETLQQWDIQTFLQRCHQTTRTEMVQPYLQLAPFKDYLSQLKQLYNADNFSSTQAAAAWWQDWHQVLSQLPAIDQLPTPFAEQLEKIAIERRGVWFDILDTFLLSDPQPVASVCHEEANSLETWQQWDAHFLKYYNHLKRLAWQRETTECIAATDWQPAQQALAQFKNAGGDKTVLAQLQILLDVKQAEADSVDRLADILREQWFLVHNYLPEKVGDLLYKAIRHTWQHNDKARLSHLKQLARRLTYQQRPASLTLWIDWLDIEEALLTPAVSPNTLADFVKRVFVHNANNDIVKDAENHVFIHDELRAPLQRLVTQWQYNNSVLFAWFYNACQRVQPPLIHEAIEPLTQLTQQSEQTAAQVKHQLAQLADISDTDLTAAQRILQIELALWQRLIDYSKLLPFPPAHQPVAPDSLDEVNALVDNLIQIKQQFVQLEHADLREAQPQRDLNNVQGFVSNKLPGFFAHHTWLNRANALEPLTRLDFFLSQFQSATRCFGCNGSEDNGCEQPDPLNPKHDWLGTMAQHLLTLIDVFAKANVIEHGMWQRVSLDCWTFVCQKGGVLLSVPLKPDLQALYDLLATLNDEEKQFRTTLDQLYREASRLNLPTGWHGDVSTNKYKPFFAAFPIQPPRTRRCYWLFEKETRKAHIATLLKQAHSQSQLPAWVNEFLDGSTAH